jgi:mannose-6-phosphate isomerase class I
LIKEPIFFERNRVGRVYTGGKLFADLFGDPAVDNYLPEEWIASSVRALNKGSTDPKEGISKIKDSDLYFDDLLKQYPEELLGKGNTFRILVKGLDSAIRLPAQAHPDKPFSRKHFNSNYGKTECWLILGTRPDAKLYFGFKEGVTQADFEAAIDRSETEPDAMEELMEYIYPQVGQMYFVPAKTVHAIGKGCLIAEIQQNSDLTYRVYDFDRVGADGKLRELHVDDALAVIDKIEDPSAVRADANEDLGIIAKCGYFTVYHFEKAFSMKATEESFVHLLCLGGEASVTWNGGEMKIAKGESVYIPAGMGEFSVSEGADIVVSTL